MRCELTDYEWNAIKPFRPNKPRGDAPCWQSALARKEGVIVWLIVALMGSNEGFVPDLIGDRALRYAVARVFHRHRHHQPAAARHDRCHCSDFASAWCAGAMAEHAAGRVPVEIDPKSTKAGILFLRYRRQLPSNGSRLRLREMETQAWACHNPISLPAKRRKSWWEDRTTPRMTRHGWCKRQRLSVEDLVHRPRLTKAKPCIRSRKGGSQT